MTLKSVERNLAGADAAIAHWLEALAGAPLALDLASDRARGAHGPTMTESFTIAEPIVAQLRDVARARGATLETTVLAAFAAFLVRHSGQDDLVIGVDPRGGGDEPLPLRVTLARRTSFAELVTRTTEAHRAGSEHGRVPFERVLEALDVPREPGRHPLYQASFAFDSGGGEATRVRPAVDVDLTLWEHGAELRGEFAFDGGLFERSTAARLRARLLVLVEDAARRPDADVSALAILPAPERSALLRDATPVEVAVRETVTRRFEAQAARTPDAIAVVGGDVTLTYRDLDERANRLAHALRDRGVGPDVLVAFCLERTTDPIVAILGVLKAGGAYLPIDPSYPSERRAWILSDSKATIALTDRATAGQLEAETVLVLEDVLASETRASAPDVTVSLEHLAYVIYTSGSTGRPKGSLIRHANLARLMRATEGWFHFGPEDRWTVFHSFAFDFSVWEVWGALLYGGRAIVVPHVTSRDPAAMVELVVERGVTVLNQTPSAFRAFMQAALARGSSLPLRWVVFGGEALDIPSLAPWFERYGDQVPRLVNMYGITETTVHVTHRPLDAADTRSPRSVIGVPIPDLSLHVLDPCMEPCPFGVTGELYVGGAGLSRGYLRRPELTAERFVPDPFVDRPGARLYRSGDLGRRLASGEIEYLGRADFQVKIRGFRIELGEIEQALARHPSVKEAVVLVREDVPGDKRLVGYATAKDGAAVLQTELKEHLRGSLPEYMVPAACVVVERWPLTQNGKLDRAALPAPDTRTAAGDAPAPKSEIEQALATIWCALLRVDAVALDDDFFELGGHSLLLAQLAVRVRKDLGLEMSLASLFDALTLREMSAMIAGQLAKSSPDAAMDALLAEIEGLSPEEAEALLGGDAG